MEQTKTKEKNREIDMLHGKLAGKLIMFALPLAFSTILLPAIPQTWQLSADLPEAVHLQQLEAVSLWSEYL